MPRIISEIMFIYCLKHPVTKEVFYVGQSKDVFARLLNHVQKASSLKTGKDKIIAEICKSGKLPEYEILEEIKVNTKSRSSVFQISDRESYWIEELSKTWPLQNIQKLTKRYMNNTEEGVTLPLLPLEKKCLYCHKKFTPKNQKGRFCSDKCRVYYSRQKIKLGLPTPEVFDAKNRDFNDEVCAEKNKPEPTRSNLKEIEELENELLMIPDKTKGLGKIRALFLKNKINNLKNDTRRNG